MTVICLLTWSNNAVYIDSRYNDVSINSAHIQLYKHKRVASTTMLRHQKSYHLQDEWSLWLQVQTYRLTAVKAWGSLCKDWSQNSTVKTALINNTKSTDFSTVHTYIYIYIMCMCVCVCVCVRVCMCACMRVCACVKTERKWQKS